MSSKYVILSTMEVYHIKSRIDGLVKYENHKKYYFDISLIIHPNKYGMKSLNNLLPNEYYELTQYLDNVEANNEPEEEEDYDFI